MKKPIEKRKIKMTWGKDAFIDRGIQIWVKKTWFIISPIVLITMAISYYSQNNLVEVICLFTAILSIAVWYYSLYRKGKKFWKENKDKQEPIQIERLPDMWGRKRIWDDNNEKTN